MRKGVVRKKKSLSRVIFGWLAFILLIVLFVSLGVYLMGERTIVVGQSMAPTLTDGDVLLVDRISYHFFDPGRYDVVVFPSRYQSGTNYIKRIIGLPGETVKISGGNVYINGQKLDELYDFGAISEPGRAMQEITLGNDEYFVLGDNRDDSSDSREPSMGNVENSEIVGRAVWKIWPLSHFGPVR